MNIGDEWIYRLRDRSPSERIRIVGVAQRKRRVQVDIALLDGTRPAPGKQCPATGFEPVEPRRALQHGHVTISGNVCRTSTTSARLRSTRSTKSSD